MASDASEDATTNPSLLLASAEDPRSIYKVGLNTTRLLTSLGDLPANKAKTDSMLDTLACASESIAFGKRAAAKAW